MEESRSAFKILTGIFTGKKPLRRPRRGWDNIRMDLKQIETGVCNRRPIPTMVAVLSKC